MRNRKRGKRLISLLLSALLLIPAPAVHAKGPSGTSQLEELTAGKQLENGGLADGGQEEGPAGGQGDSMDGFQRDASPGDTTGGSSEGFTVDGEGILTEYTGAGGAITIPATVGGVTVTGIAENIFDGKKQELTKVTISEGITEIPYFLFRDCANLEEVVFPETLEEIGNGSFDGCGKLAGVEFPEGLGTIGSFAFRGCTSLKSICLPLNPQRVTWVGESAFESCTALESITFQEGENKGCYLFQFAFKGCTSLASVELPAKAEVYRGAFQGCTSLTEFKAAEGSWYDLFDGCLYKAEDGLTADGPRTELVACPAGKAEVTFREGITSIMEYAFAGCTGLTSVEIPDTVTKMGLDTFTGCSRLTKVVLPKNIDRIELGQFRETGITGIEIPETVTVIRGYAFAGCQGLKTFTFPGTVSELQQFTFESCGNLESVYIEEGVECIGAYAFNECNSLKALVIPKSVTEIHPLKGSGSYENLTIYGEAGSYAETYAKQNNIRFSTGQPGEDGPDDGGYDISDAAFTVTLAQEVYDYDGKAKRPIVTVKKGEEELLRGTDFTVEYKDNTNPGTAKAIVRGADKYSGEVTKEFTIKGIDISGTGFTVALSESKYTYDGKAKEPAVTVTKGTEKLQGTDFMVTYENNINPGTAKAIVTGAGIYTGTVTKEFTIEPAPKDISGPRFAVTLSGDSYTYDGKEKRPAVTVKEGDTELLRGTDFTVKYENNINPGTAKAIVTGAGVYTGTVTKEFTIKEAKKKNIGLTCKKIFAKKYGDKAFPLQAKAAKGAKITYKTSDKKVAVVDKKGKVTIKGTGIATITLKATALGYAPQTMKIAVKVSPSKAPAPSLKALRGRRLKVSWKRDSRATGYQVQYCTSKTFKKGVKAVTVSKNKTVTKTIPKLAKGKRYYVRVRAYKSVKVNKKTQKLYGAWSAAKRSGKILR